MKTSEECYVCAGKTIEEIDSWFAHRCEKHNVCLKCGTNRKDLEEIPWGKRGGFICKPCEARRQKEEIEAYQRKVGNREEEFADGKVICPYCGADCYDWESSDMHTEGDDFEVHCGNCDSYFDCSTSASYYYTTTKKEQPKE